MSEPMSSSEFEMLAWDLIETVAVHAPSRRDLRQALEHVWNHTYGYEEV